MEQRKWVITGINKLTGERMEMTGAMTEEEARARLEREQESRRYQRYQAFKNLRVEKQLPVQLTIKFEAYD